MTPDADAAFMMRALALAERGLATTMPNPRVGCLLVKDGEVVGEGWHERAGEAHAEVNALRHAGARAAGATAYVTLEPCCHHGRTPPCADALIAAGVARVVAAMADPNPLVAGEGMARLRAAGVSTACGLLEEKARAVNAGFVARMTRGLPWVRVKVAASLDGRSALANGASRWITGEAARRDGHAWRARACAILTGSGTALADDPQLTVRDVPCARQPLRVVADSRLRLPVSARVLDGGGTLVACAAPDLARAAALAKRQAEVVVLPGAQGQVDLEALLRALALRGVNELHVEAGATLNGALLRAGLVDEVLAYLAPRLLGERARGMFELGALEEVDDGPRLRFDSIDPIGADVRVRALVDGVPGRGAALLAVPGAARTD